MDKNKKYIIETGSIRKRIYDVCLRKAEGFTTDEIIERVMKSKTADFSEAAVCHNLLALVRDKVFLNRIQKPNPITGRPVYYYIANPEPKIPVSVKNRDMAEAA